MDLVILVNEITFLSIHKYTFGDLNLARCILSSYGLNQNHLHLILWEAIVDCISRSIHHLLQKQAKDQWQKKKEDAEDILPCDGCTKFQNPPLTCVYVFCSESHLCLSPMESTMNPTLTSAPSSAGDGGIGNGNGNGNGISTDELTRLSPDSPHGSEKNDGVDFSHEQGSESNPDTENDTRTVNENKSSETEDVLTKDSKTEPDSLDDDVEIVIKNQHKYYIYCPCCGEDITKTVKLVKKSDLKSMENPDTKNEVNDTENVPRSKDKKKTTFPSWFPVYLQKLFHSVYGYTKDKGEKGVDLKSPGSYGIDSEEPSIDFKIEKDSESFPNEGSYTENVPRSKDKKKTTFPSWFPIYPQQLFHSVYGHTEDKGEKGVDTKSPGSYIDLGTDHEEPNIDFETEKDGETFPKWYLDVFAWLFVCIIVAISFLSSPPQQPPPNIPLDLELPSISSFELPSVSLLWLLPTFVVWGLVIMTMRSHYSPRHHEEKGDKEVDSKSSDTNSIEQSLKPQKQDDQTAGPGQDSDKKTDNQKIHPTPLDPSLHEQPTDYPKIEEQAELQQKTKLEIPNIFEPLMGGNKLEVLKSIVYGGLTESITSLCTVTSAASSGASTLNVLALGVANLSSGVLLVVHNLRELINEKPRTRTKTTDQNNSEADEEKDRYEETLGKRERSKLHSVIAISSFLICGLIPPLVYGFSFRRRIEKKQEYKTLAVYAASLTCIVLLSIAKAYVAKKREYLKTLFRYVAMATTASGVAQFIGYFVSQFLEKNGFYEDYPQTIQV